MEATKREQKLSLAALIVSLLPLLTLVPVFLNVTLPDDVRTIWAVCNIVLALAGLLLSMICVKSEKSRSAVNILSTIISVVRSASGRRKQISTSAICRMSRSFTIT